MSDLSKIEELYKRIDELEEIVKELHPTHAYFNPKPTEPECVSTLTQKEILKLYNYPEYAEGHTAILVTIANAACKAERERIAGLPAVTSLSDNALTDMDRPLFEHRLRIANSAIAQFQRDLLEGKI